MARPRLDPGEHAEIVTSPYWRVDGMWQRLPNGAHHKHAERWRARTTLRDYAGEVHDVQANARRKAQATAEVERKIKRILSGGSPSLKESTLLSDAAPIYLEQIRRAESGLSIGTIGRYEKNVERYILSNGSTIRGLSLAQVNRVPTIRRFLQSVADNHGSAMARSVRSTLSGILRMAVEDGALPANAAREVSHVESATPREPDRDHRRAFTTEEWSHLVETADKRATAENLDPRSVRRHEAVRDLVLVMGAEATRITEARTLVWEDFDLDGDFPHVLLRGTKSKAARRRLDLPQWLVRRLQSRIETMRAHYQDAARWAKHTQTETRAEVVARLTGYADQVGSSGLVFPSPARLDPERPWDQSNANNAVRQLLDAAGFTWAVPHTLRRTAITRLGEAGKPINAIADFAGHSNPAMTLNVYLGRDFGGEKSDLAAVMENLG
jgi:integrase